MLIKESYSEKVTIEMAEELAQHARPGSIYALRGNLGVGKTVFAKGFAKGLGIEENIASPTFTFILQYEKARMPLYHFDMYRIADPDELEEIGYEEYFYGQGTCLIEWPERVEDLLPENTINITIKKELSKGLTYRLITVEEHNNEDIGD